MTVRSFTSGRRKTRALRGYERTFACSVFMATLLRLSPCGIADELTAGRQFSFDIPRQSADLALTEFAEQADITLVFRFDEVRNRTANRLLGRFSIERGLEALLAGSGLRPSFANRLVVSIATTAPLEPEGEDMKATAKGLLSLLASFLGASGAAAQGGEASGADNRTLEEIIVTAQRRAESITDVPMTISAIGNAELRERGIADLLDLSFAVPELTVFDTTPGNPFYALRGIGSVAGDSLVGVYFDEAPVTGPSGLQIDIRTIDLERVEILHGPQGTLYGQGSAGGTIRIITKDPHFDRFEVQMGASASVTKGGAASQSVTGVANIPIVDDVLAVRVAAASERIGGWLDTSSGRKDVNDQSISYLRAKTLLRPVDRLELIGTAVIHRNDAGFGNAPADEDRTIPLPAYAPDIDLPNDNNYDLFNLTATYDLGFSELLSSTSTLDIDSESSFTNFLFATQRDGEVSDRLETFSQEIRLVSSGESAVNWTVGGLYNEFEYDNLILFTIGLDDTVLAEDIPVPTFFDNSSFAVYADVNLDITDRLNLGAGVRYFEEDKSLVDGTSSTFDSVDPRFYLSYDLTDSLKLYGSVADGFRSGGFNGTFSGIPSTYGPETVRSYEFGAKFQTPNGRFDGQLALFSADYTDVHTQVVDPITSITFIDNVGEGEIEGIDASMRLAISDSLFVAVSGTVIDTAISEIPSGAAYEPGDNLNFIPEYSYSVSANYDLRWTDEVSGYVRIDYNEQGEATYVLRDLAIFNESEVAKLLNLRIGAHYKAFRFSVFAANLLDNDSQLNASPTLYFSRPRPRTIGVDALMSF